MDYEYYGITKEVFDTLIGRRDDYIQNYWRSGRHFSKHIKKDPGLASRIVDKAVYDNILKSFYGSSPVLDVPQGVFYGYGRNDFTSVHLPYKYLLKLDFKSCYRNITFTLFWEIIAKHSARLVHPLPKELIKSIYFPNNYLQAGLVASNIICDLVLKYNIDKSINKIIFQGNRQCAVYSRYYDDIYVSSDDKNVLKAVREEVKEISKRINMPLNYRKCYLRTLNGSVVLGSTIIDGEIRISRKHKNNVRAAMFQIEKMDRNSEQYERVLRSIVSKLANICQNENRPNPKYTDAYESYREELRELTDISLDSI